MSATKSTIARPTADELRRLYVDQQLGCPEIGRLYGRDAKTVHWWLKQAEIPTRPRGADERQHFKKGHLNGFAGRRHSARSVEKIKAATIAQGRVPYLKNGRHWLAGRPVEDNPNWKGGITPERQEFYRSDEWRIASKAVWTRADGKCERCAKDSRLRDPEVEPTFHVHHIVPFSVKELRASVSNLALLCRPCHLFVHSRRNTKREFLEPSPVPDLFGLALEKDAA